MAESSYTPEVLATRGGRLALSLLHWTGAHRSVGPSEIAWLEIAEMDGDGRFAAIVTFDAADLDAAYAELDTRHAAGEAADHPRVAATMRAFLRAFESRDWDALAAQFTPDLVVDDHRRLGWETLRGPAEYVRAMRSLVDLAPDVRLRLDHVRGCDRGLFWAARWLGTQEGGPFEAAWLTVSEHDVRGRVRRFDQYDLDQLDAALARYAELAEVRPHPLRIPPNAATRASKRIAELVAASDWPALRALTAPDFTFDDRRRRSLVSGGVDLYIKNLEWVRSWRDRRVERELLASVGDRVSLERIVFVGDVAGSVIEGEFLLLSEVDAEGRSRAVIHFDAEGRSDAFAEAHARFAAGEAAASGGQAPLVALSLAMTRHDWENMRSCLAPDAVVHDHRPLSLGELTRDQWVESHRVQVELAPDVKAEAFRILAWNSHGRVVVCRRFGTLRDGGSFENVFVVVEQTDGDHIEQYEIFDVPDADRALARFEELCAGRP
jgi:hypothetical protein